MNFLVNFAPDSHFSTLQKLPRLSKSKKAVKKIRKPQRKKQVEDIPSFGLKHYLLRVCYILIGPLITWPILDEEGPLRFLGLSLLFSGYHLFVLLFLDLLPEFAAYLESEAPMKSLTLGQERFNKIISLGFFVSLGCFLGSIKLLDRTVHGMPVFWSCIGGGIVIAALLIRWSVKKPFPFITSDNAAHFGIGFLFGIPMFLCSLFFIPNRYMVLETIKNKPVEIIQKSVGSGGRRSGDTHNIFLLLDGKTERVTVGQAQYDVLGDTAYCDLTKGIFGYYYIDKIAAHP